jgi:hypothetical protein
MCAFITMTLHQVCCSEPSFFPAGNHYGTPKPSKEPPVSPPQSSCPNSNLSSAGLVLGALFPGVHPSSEGKRKRNRSNVEAMAAKNMEPEATGGHKTIYLQLTVFKCRGFGPWLQFLRHF